MGWDDGHSRACVLCCVAGSSILSTAAPGCGLHLPALVCDVMRPSVDARGKSMEHLRWDKVGRAGCDGMGGDGMGWDGMGWDRIGSDRIGSDRIGLDWIGSDQFGFHHQIAVMTAGFGESNIGLLSVECCTAWFLKRAFATGVAALGFRENWPVRRTWFCMSGLQG